MGIPLSYLRGKRFMHFAQSSDAHQQAAIRLIDRFPVWLHDVCLSDSCYRHTSDTPMRWERLRWSQLMKCKQNEVIESRDQTWHVFPLSASSIRYQLSAFHRLPRRLTCRNSRIDRLSGRQPRFIAKSWFGCVGFCARSVEQSRVSWQIRRVPVWEVQIVLCKQVFSTRELLCQLVAQKTLAEFSLSKFFVYKVRNDLLNISVGFMKISEKFKQVSSGCSLVKLL